MRVIHDWRWSLRLIGDALEELRIRPVGVIHVGAHLGQEVPLYLSAGFTRIALIEPDPQGCAVMAGQSWIDNPGVGIVNRACGARGSATFHRMAEDAFSGLVQNVGQVEVASFSVQVVPISDIQAEYPGNVLVVDTQGTELDALYTADVSTLDLIIIEVQSENPGAPGAYWPDLITWCREAGWIPRIQWKRDDRWSDVLLTPRRLTEPEPTP